MKKSFIILGLISSLLFAQEDNVKNLAQGLNLPSPAEGHRGATELEKGGAGATLSPVARQIVDYYFDFHANINTVENAYTLLK